MDRGHDVGFGNAIRTFFFIIIQRLHIPVIINRLKTRIRHPKLLALINIRRSLQHVNEGSQHFGRGDAVIQVIAEPGY
ncbi:hypothetical protein D3C86_1790290 [compost metagenome]